jgi:glycerol-3-phosphate dehydrogenase (NAD(P)+)
MSVVTIVGAGMMGSAMSFPAADNGHEVRIVGIHNRKSIESVRASGYHTTLKRQLPAGVKAYHIEQLSEALDGADLVISGVSSFGAEWFEQTVIPIIPDTVPVLSITKGLEKSPDGTLISYPEAIMRRAEKCGRHISYNAVGGPVISFELADRQQTSIEFCGKDMAVLRQLKSMLSTDYYHISLTTDIAGLETAVAMKNAYALGVALAIGINDATFGKGQPEHYNPQAALFEQSVKETRKLMQMLGGRSETLMYFAGDLFVTVFGGRTRRIGILLGEGVPYTEAMEILAGVTLESVAIATKVAESLRLLQSRGQATTEDFPLLMHIDSIINNGEKVNIPWEKFEEEFV